MLTAQILALASSSLMPHTAGVVDTDIATEPAQVLVEVRLRRAELEGGMDAIRAATQNAPNVIPRGSVGGPAVFIGEAVVFTTEMGYVEVISSPRILTLEGQQAEIVVGEPVSYVELVDEGELRLVSMDDAYEGLRIAMNPAVRDSGLIDFPMFEVTISEVIGRTDIRSAEGDESLPIAGGQPVVRSVTYAMPLTLKPNEDGEASRADILFATDASDERVFWMSVNATVQDPTDGE